MKVSRLVIVEHADNGRHIAARDGICTAEQAVEGLPIPQKGAAPSPLERLHGGEAVKFDLKIAGLRLHGRIVPLHLPNRQGMERLKREKQRA